MSKEIAVLNKGLATVEDSAITSSQTAASEVAETQAAVASLREALQETDHRLSENIDADLESMKQVRTCCG